MNGGRLVVIAPWPRSLALAVLLCLGLSLSSKRAAAEELTNGAFDGDITSSWTYFDWVDAEGKFTGPDPDTGGNPDGNAELKWESPVATTTTNSGYWQESFTITGSVTNARIKFDWRQVERVGLGGTATNGLFEMYVFVDTASGAPTIGSSVWMTSGLITTSWGTTSMQDIDISSIVTGAGTYYVKLAMRATALNARVRAAYDNLSLVVLPESGVRVWRGDTSAWGPSKFATIQAAIDSISTSIAAWSVDSDGNAVVFEVMDSAT